MKIIILLILALTIFGAWYFASQKANPSKLGQAGSNQITKQQALEKVRNLPEVQSYLKRVPNGRVEVDNEMAGEYNVHVYEIKDGHTATFNWYRVSIKSGEVRAEF